MFVSLQTLSAITGIPYDVLRGVLLTSGVRKRGKGNSMSFDGRQAIHLICRDSVTLRRLVPKDIPFEKPAENALHGQS